MPWLFNLTVLIHCLAPFGALAANSKTLEIALFDGGIKNLHHIEVRKVILQEVQTHCPGKVTLKDFSLFTAKGSFDSNSVVKSLESLALVQKSRILHFSWNDAQSPIYASFEQVLRKAAANGTPIVAAVGENVDDPNRMLKLSQTVMGSSIGKSNFGFLIGELNERGQLSARSNYGEELFTALPPKKGKAGSSFSAPLFSARLACALALKKKNITTVDFINGLRVKKNSFNTLYPSLENLFPGP